MRFTKRAGDHASLIDDAKLVVAHLQADSNVKRISPGVITPKNNRASLTLKLQLQPGCLLVRVHGRASVQEIRVYGSNLEAVRDMLIAAFPTIS